VTTQKSTEPEMIGFLMIPQFSMIAFSAAIEPLRLANYLSGQEFEFIPIRPLAARESGAPGSYAGHS
jgi:transcriptional regulator GlxA family with amidase domain